MAAPAIIEWFGQGMLPAVLLGVGGFAHALPKQLAFVDNQLFMGITPRLIVGVASVAAAITVLS